MKKLIRIFVCVSVFLFSCSIHSYLELDDVIAEEKEWTILIYMAADNNLEAAAIRDFNELEAVKFNKNKISVIVLLDRSPSYDNSNDNWIGTRLYEIKYDALGLDSIIRSKEIDCPVLDIGPGKETNLDTSDYKVLENVIDFTKNNYKAKNFGLIIWGHGSGWRSQSKAQSASISGNDGLEFKAFAFDDTSDSYMGLVNLRKAVENKSLSFIGFDTCFGGILELAYELKDETKMIIASPSTVGFDGWDYKNLLYYFNISKLSLDDFASAALYQFQLQYEQEPSVALSIIRTHKVAKLKEDFDVFAKNFACQIETIDDRQACLDIIFNDLIIYTEQGIKSDLFLDIASFVNEGKKKYPHLSQDAQAVLDSIEEAVPFYWASKPSEFPCLGVFFSETENGVPSAKHPISYVQGSGALSLARFVKESDGWVPHQDLGDSFLDVVFYKIF